MRDVCDALVVSRPWMILYKKVLLKSSLGWNQNGIGSNAFLRKKINVLVWTNVISWTIHDDWRYKVCEGRASFGKSSHVVGSNGNLLNKKEWTSSKGGATMQTSPCRVFRNPILCFLIWHSPDRVHRGPRYVVNWSNIFCTQNIIVLLDFVWGQCICPSPG